MTADPSTRLLFTTQSIGLKVFWSLHQALRRQAGDQFDGVGFFVTDQYQYRMFCELNPEFEATCDNVLCEWTILEKARALAKPNLEFLDEAEREYGDPTFWNGILCDRRLNYPAMARFAQSYKNVYPHAELLKIVEVAIQEIRQQFQRVRPTAVLGLNAVTLYDHLYYLIATRSNIPYFQLKLTRIWNYVSLYTEPLVLSPHIRNRFEQYCDTGALLAADAQLHEEAQRFLEEATSGKLTYEGAIQTAKTPVVREEKRSPVKELSKLRKLKIALATRDRHNPHPLTSLWYQRVIRPARKRWLRGYLQDQSDLTTIVGQGYRYAFFPLNTEPEVALLVYGRMYRNQIETARNIAVSLPVGWKLVIKEHPNAFGYRTRNYYKKLREIPNVLVLDAAVDSKYVLAHCSLVMVIYGTIGFEAILKRKPLVTLCETPYGVFSRLMVRYVDSLNRLAGEIRDLVDNYEYNEAEVIAYIAAHIQTSVQVNLFTGLLAKSGRVSRKSSLSLQQQYMMLAQYTLQRIQEERTDYPAIPSDEAVAHS